MPQTTQQLIARQEALKRAMAANPKNKATQKLGASALASTNSKLSSVKSKVEQVQKYKNASKPASSNDSQIRNRAQYLLNFGQTKQTPVNTVNGMPSSSQLVRAEDQSAKAQIKQISEGFNVVYDPVTGKNYSPNSAKGKELLASSGLNYKDYLKGIKTSGTGSVENVATYAELGADMLNKDLADTASVEKEIFGESGAPTTLDEYKQMQKESIARKYSEANRSLDYQRQASEDQFMDSRRGVATSGEVLAGQLASGQEGVVSNSATLDRMRALTKERQQRLAAEFQDLDAKISSARADLKEAYAANKTALAQDIQSKLNAYEMEAKRIDTELSNALTQQLGAESDYASTQSAIKQSGLTLFQNVVAQGQPMDYSVIRGYAEQLGLPVEMLMGYYENNQQIRDDKTLDFAAKEQLYRQNEQNLQDQMTGMDTEAAKNTKAYISLVQMGASQDVLDSFKKAAGLRIDPFEQVKGEAMMLENEILQYQVDNLGQPPPEGSPERVDYDLKMLELSAKKKELRDMYGYKDITLDEAKSIFFVDGKSAFHQNDPEWGDGTNQWECGEGYRKITDYPNPVGNTYAEKFSKVTKGLETPQIGFGLVLPLGDSGHLETVISNPDPVTGTFQTLSWNRNGKGGMTIENYNINDLKAKYGDGWGFIESSLKPEFAEKLASAGLGGENSSPYSYQNYYSEAKDQGMSDEAASKYAEKRYAEANSSMTEAQMKVYDAYVSGKLEEQTYTRILDENNVTSEDLANGTNAITKAVKGDEAVTADVINSLGISEPVQRALMSELAWVEAVLRKKSGAAITASEYATYGRMYFPRVGDTEATLSDKKKRRESQIKGLYGQLSEAGKKQYDLDFNTDEQITQTSELDPDVEEYNSFDYAQDDDYWAGREALGIPAPWIERAMDLVESRKNQ